MVIFSKTKKSISQQTPKGSYIYDVHMEEGWGGDLKFCKVFVDVFVFKEKIYYSVLKIRGFGVTNFFWTSQMFEP